MKILRTMIMPLPPAESFLQFHQNTPKEDWANILTSISRVYGARFEFQDSMLHSGFRTHPRWKKQGLIFVGTKDMHDQADLNWAIITSYTHELAHAIQHRFYGYPTHTIPDYSRRLSVQLEFEWEACRLSYYIYKAYFHPLCPNLHFNYFQSYRDKLSQRWLLESWQKSNKVKLIDDVGVS